MNETPRHVAGVRAVPLRGTPLVSLGLALPTGFACDPPDAPGAAHLCEHAALAAVPSDLLGSLPVTAVTGCHHTTFTVDVPAEECDTALRALAALVRPDPAALERAARQERPVVALELAMSARSSGIGAAVAARLAPHIGPGHASAATPATVGDVPFAAVLDHGHTAYTPHAAVLAMAGAITPAHLDRAAGLFPGADDRPPLRTAVPGPATTPEPVWGIAALRSPHAEPRAPWADLVEEALVRPGSPTDALARVQGATPVGSTVLRCHHGDLLLAAYRNDTDSARNAEEAAAALHSAVLTEANLDKLVAGSVQVAARSHTTRRSRLRLPWEARDALLAHATGLGAQWEDLHQPFDRPAATAQVASTLHASVPWAL
ncbi:insulinase family protein [Streptomyces sp. NPDC005180]|uniref:insulinase family protein n=1 Tax=Streptomyces sp. NPDC005180 TaxID=3156868 RepID=UPI0033B93219